jgi:anti-sigma B factor antagonist
MSPVVKVIQPSGIFDGTKANGFEQEINQCLETGAEIILVDLENVSFMDSSGLRVLVSALKIIKASDRKLVVCSVNKQVRLLFELASVDKFFEIYPNQAAFEQSLVS